MINGYVIQKKTNKFLGMNKDSYMGLGKFEIWPLQVCEDEKSVLMSKEAENKWLTYCDGRPLVIPDFNFVKRYMEHCNKLGIEVFCFSIESNDCSYCLEHNLSDFKVLGYDYVDVDMCTSCLYEDITSDCLEYRKIYSSIFLKLNKHLLFDSIVDMEKYLEIRAYAKTFDFDIEEYFNPLIVRVGIKVTQ